jgi:hypothetical protein
MYTHVICNMFMSVCLSSSKEEDGSEKVHICLIYDLEADQVLIGVDIVIQ